MAWSTGSTTTIRCAQQGVGSLPMELREPLLAKPSDGSRSQRVKKKGGELREQFDRVAVLYQRVSPGAGQDEP